jgi:predicted Zn-dependent peptidase
VQKWFGSFPKLPKPERKKVAAPAVTASTLEVSDTFARLEQIQRTWMGPEVLSDDAFALEAALTILGNDGWGRLYKRLVVTEPLCQAVRVGVDAKHHNSELVVILQLKPGVDRQRALTILDEELKKLTEEAPSAAELRRYVVNTESDFVWGLEDLAQRADQLQWFNHYTGDPGYVGKYLERVRAVTPEAALAAAKRWLQAPYVQVTTVPALDKAPQPTEKQP